MCIRDSLRSVSSRITLRIRIAFGVTSTYSSSLIYSKASSKENLSLIHILKGYAQRTSNEWPAVGISVPAWLSDYSNYLVVAGNGNLIRWMHVTPWKQDV